MSFLADCTSACSTIGYHSNSWASCQCRFRNLVIGNRVWLVAC